MMNSAVPMFDNNKKVIGVVVINQDITKFIQIENELKSSLADKEMLMKEIHHRVKNNFQIISSLLSLQINSPKNKSADEILSESRDRIKSMAILHEKLYKSQDINSINFEGYIKGVLNNLQSSYRLKEKNISLEIDIDEVIVSIDSAINLGLIINEIVVNSLKHAFTDKVGGTIIIRLKEKESEQLILIIKDNGKGIPEEIDVDNTDSLGILLINSFVKQVKGEIKLIRNNGTEFQIVFPKGI